VAVGAKRCETHLNNRVSEKYVFVAKLQTLSAQEKVDPGGFF